MAESYCCPHLGLRTLTMVMLIASCDIHSGADQLPETQLSVDSLLFN